MADERNENDGPSNAGNPTIGASAVSETKPPDSVPSKPATEADLQEVKRKMSGFERSTLRWTRASFFILAATAVFIGLQWLEIRSGGADTHDLAVAAGKQADKMRDMSDAADKIRQAAEGMVVQEQRIADNAKNALDASNRQSKAALDASIAAARLDERPWVLPRSFKLSGEPATEKPLSVEIYAVNTGKTPAIDVSPQSQIGLQYNCDTMPEFQELKDVKSRGMLPPGQLDVSSTSDPMSITEPMVTSYRAGLTRVIAQGLIGYTDEFNTYHWTRFRVYHEHGNPPEAWSYCKTGNDVDRAKDKKKAN